MDKYLNKKVEIREKVFSEISSTKMIANAARDFNAIVGVITNIYNDRFIELDNKILISLDFIYKIELLD